jgi:dynein intermediate chain 4, axonemal
VLVRLILIIELLGTDDYVVPKLNLLWNFKCDLTSGRSVTSVSWNKENEDILAVGYGESKVLLNSSPGLVLVWSARNLEWPDRVYTCNHPVTALDFSKSNPFLLAAGLADGRIVMFDIRQRKDKIILDGGDGEGKHRGPVWELKWVERQRVAGDEQSRDESLVSVSSDGRVTQWSIRKGLEFSG